MNCGAPLGVGASPDPHQCPYCNRRLLALGSPNCNYCGRRLPEEFIQANTADLHRVKEMSGSNKAVEETHLVNIVERASHQEKSSGPLSILYELTDLLS